MDYHLIGIYQLYKNPIFLFLRVCLAGLLSLAIFSSYTSSSSFSFFVFFLNLLIMGEIFYRYKISRIQTKQTINDVSEHEEYSHVMTFPALSSVYHHAKVRDSIRKLTHYPQVRFFLERANIALNELPDSDLNSAVVSEFALKLAKQVGGKRITTMDLIAAFILLEEDNARLLFSKKLKQEDVLQILSWTRLQFPNEEEIRKFHVGVNGGGIGEDLVTGWTLETRKYTRNFTYSVREKEISIVGREKEYERLIGALSRGESNNVILIGEAGSGKKQLVRKIALDSYNGRLVKGLNYKNILELLVGSLLAGATSQGELQERVGHIIEEVSHARNVILYIPEFQDMIGAGSFSLDLSGALAPYLQSGNIPIIASITKGNFKTYLERSSLNELFSSITLDPITNWIAERIVMEKTREIEHRHNIIITYKALTTAVKFADRYSQSLILPGSAVALLSDAVSSLTYKHANYYGKTKKVLIAEEEVVGVIEEKTKIAISEPTQKERDMLLNLESILHQRVVGQDTAVRSISEALRRLRSGIENRNRPISFLFLGPTGVGKTETAKAIADAYFSSSATLIRLDMSEYADEQGQRRLLGALPGQGQDRGELTEQVRDHPYALILLDEFEKSHPTIQNLFLQILEDGRLTDNLGHTISFINTMIIATSNAGSVFIHEAIEQGKAINADFEKELFEYLQHQNLFKPELLNRFDAVITFKSLDQEEVNKIAQLLLNDLSKQLKEKDITISFDSKVVSKVSNEAFNKELGARPIRRYIQDTIEDILSQKILSEEIVRGNTLHMTVNDSDQFFITTAAPLQTP